MRRGGHMSQSRADRIVIEGKSYALRVSKGDIADYVLAPGDPARIDKITRFWDKSEEVAFNRHYRVVKGLVKGVPVSAVSHGVGGPSIEVALNELAELGAKTVIRIGTSGSLSPDVQLGDLVINTGAVRFDGTTSLYIWPEYPAFADYEVTAALIQACEELGFRYAVGVAATMGSFFAGQGRPAASGYRAPGRQDFLEELKAAGVINLEMEGATLFTLARLFGQRAGMIVAIEVDRVRNVFASEGVQERACQAATRAVEILSEWDQIKKKHGKKLIYPGLLAVENRCEP